MNNRPNDAPMNSRNGGARIDTDLMQPISGPHKHTKPRTVTLGQRIMRRLNNVLHALDAWETKRRAAK